VTRLRQVAIEAGGRRWLADLSRPLGIAIPLAFGGDQPSFFGAPAASATPLRSGSFVGDVAQGGSCRCSTLSLTPHCNGTHTECVGHVVADAVSVHAIAGESLMIARVASVTPEADPVTGTLVITAGSLQTALAGKQGQRALVVRTLPNPADKVARQYSAAALPAFFTAAALQWLVDQDCRHLVVDLPSIDRADDDSLAGHRIFWGLPPGSTRLADSSRADATITELAYIDDGIADGEYLLNLQVAPFASDAAPSRPVLYPLAAVTP